MMVVRPLAHAIRSGSSLIPITYRRSLSSKTDSPVKRILGDSYLGLDDKEKTAKLRDSAQVVYDKAKIPYSEGLSKAEKAYQVHIAQSPDHKGRPHPTPIRKDPTTVYWSTIHKPFLPFHDGTGSLKLPDKDVAIDMFIDLHSSKGIELEDEVLMTVPGCDNNEAGTKLRLYLQSQGIETHMIASDVNFKALGMARGLDIITREQNPKLSEAEVVVQDAFNEEHPLNFDYQGFDGQKIALPFRLTAVVPINRVEHLVSRVIQNNDLSIFHFFSDTAVTQQTLRDKHQYSERGVEEIQGVDVQYMKTSKGHTMALWDQDRVATCIQAFNGNVMDIREVETIDDHHHPVTMMVAVVKKPV